MVSGILETRQNNKQTINQIQIMKKFFHFAKALVCGALATVAVSASAEILDYGSQLEGNVVRTTSNPYTKSKFITEYKVTNNGSQSVQFKITFTYADSTVHTWNFFLAPGNNYVFDLDTWSVIGVDAVVHPRS